MAETNVLEFGSGLHHKSEIEFDQSGGTFSTAFVVLI